jgi:hypothetical protein
MQMKSRVRFLVPATVAGLLFGVLVERGIGEGQQLVPVPPDALLKVLPDAAPDWKLTASTGKTFYSTGLLSRATRLFEYAPADASAEGQGATCKITVTDTAGNTSRLGKFKDFKVEEGDGYQKIVIKTYPAIVRDIPNYGTTITMLVNKRFTLDILLKGMPLNQVGPWIEASNLGALGGVREEPIGSDSSILEMVSIDELNPAMSRTYAMVLSDKEAIAAGLENVEDIEDPSDSDPNRDDSIKKE